MQPLEELPNIGRIDNDTFLVGYNFFTNFRNLHENHTNGDLVLKVSFSVERKRPFRISRLSLHSFKLVNSSKGLKTFQGRIRNGLGKGILVESSWNHDFPS